MKTTRNDEGEADTEMYKSLHKEMRVSYHATVLSLYIQKMLSYWTMMRGTVPHCDFSELLNKFNRKYDRLFLMVELNMHEQDLKKIYITKNDSFL